jgi:hypothetical protein
MGNEQERPDGTDRRASSRRICPSLARGDLMTAMNPRHVALGAWLALGMALTGCSGAEDAAAARRFADREAIEDVLARANRAFELSEPDAFGNAFADDAVYELTGKGPVFGYQKMKYEGRADIRTIITDRLERAKNTDPKTLSYDPASLRRFNRNSDDHIEIVDAAHARHSSTWMVVMHTNVDIHTSAIGRYDDELVKRDGTWFISKRVRSE